MKTNVYVDGFNLYYRCLRGRTGTRWLDLSALCRRVLPASEIIGICYFTASVKGEKGDRQKLYWTALLRSPEITLYKGVFQAKIRRRPLVRPQEGMTDAWPRVAWFHDTEEKGSDVNLATRLLVDGYNGRYEAAAVVSNDGDLKMPIEIVRTELDRPVTIINPDQEGIRSFALSPPGSQRNARYIELRTSDIEACQFPDKIITNSGRTITKPSSW